MDNQNIRIPYISKRLGNYTIYFKMNDEYNVSNCHSDVNNNEYNKDYNKIFNKIIDYHNNWWESFFSDNLKKEERINKFIIKENYEINKYNQWHNNLKNPDLKYIWPFNRQELEQIRYKLLINKQKLENIKNINNIKKYDIIINKLIKFNTNIYNNIPKNLTAKLKKYKKYPHIKKNIIKWDINKAPYDKIELNKFEEKNIKCDLKNIQNDIERLYLLIEFVIKDLVKY